jgi:signal transduction histidine kinase
VTHRSPAAARPAGSAGGCTAADDAEAATARFAGLLARAVGAAFALVAATLVALLGLAAVVHARCPESLSAYFSGGAQHADDSLDTTLLATLMASSLTAAAAFAVRAGFPRGPCDVPIARAGLLLTLAPAAYHGLQWAGLVLPSYATQVAVIGTLEQAQLLLLVACGGRHGSVALLLLVAAAWLAADVTPLAFASAGVWTGRLPRGALPPDRLRSGGFVEVPGIPQLDVHSLTLATISRFVRQRWWVFTDRRVWGAGAATGTLPWLLHTWAGAAHAAVAVAAKCATLQSFKRRVVDPRLHVVVTALQAALVAVPLWVGLAVARPAGDPSRAAVLAANVAAWTLQYHVVPLVLLALLDAAHEHEQRALTQLAEAERSMALAEDAASRRRTVLRYVCHEARVPLQTITLGIEDLQATLLPGDTTDGLGGGDDADADDDGSGGTSGGGGADGESSEDNDRRGGQATPVLPSYAPAQHHQRALTDAPALRRRRRVGSGGSSSGGTRDGSTGALTAGGTGEPLSAGTGAAGGGWDDDGGAGGGGGGRGSAHWLPRSVRRHTADTLAVLLSAAEAARHMVDSTLTLERIDAGEYTIALRPAALRSSVVAVHELMAPLARANGVRLVTRTDARPRVERLGVPRGALALLDEVKIQQVCSGECEMNGET